MPDIENISYIPADMDATAAVSRCLPTHVGQGMANAMLPYTQQDFHIRDHKILMFKGISPGKDHLNAVFLPELGGTYTWVDGYGVLQANKVKAKVSSYAPILKNLTPICIQLSPYWLFLLPGFKTVESQICRFHVSPPRPSSVSRQMEISEEGLEDRDNPSRAHLGFMVLSGWEHSWNLGRIREHH